MPKPAITTFSSVAVKPSSTNKDNGLYAPQLTAAQIAAIPANTLVNGAIVYDTDDNRLKTRVNGIVQQINTGVGAGDVVGPAGANGNNIATFDGNTGKLIQDSNVNIIQVPPLLQNPFNLLAAPNLLVNSLENLGHIKFTNGTGFIFLDSDISVAFFLNSFGPGPTDEQVCSLFTGGFPGSSTTPSALVEIQSPTGALLLSRLSQAQINIFPFPTAGMILFNKDTNRLSFYNGTSWLDPASGDSITLTGAVTGIGTGTINTSLATTVECQNRVQIFESPVPDDFFVVGIQNQALLTTGLQIGAANAPTIFLGYNPTGTGLAYLECHGVPFEIAQNGNNRFYVTPNGEIGIGTSTPATLLNLFSQVSGGPGATILLQNAGGGGGETRIDTLNYAFNPLLTLPSSRIRFIDDALYGCHIDFQTKLRGAGTNPLVSRLYIRSTGFIGIDNSTPNAPLQFANTLVNRKIVLYELNNNDHEFLGVGVQSNILRYQVPNISSDHVFYAGTSSTTSNELARITGTGDVVVASNIYGRRPSGIIRAVGSANTTTVANTAIKIVANTTSVSVNLFSAPVNNRLIYTGARPITAQINLNLTLQPPNTLSTDYTVSIFKNGVLVSGSEVATRTDTPNYYTISTSIFTTMNTNDYIEAFIRSTRAGVMITFF